MPHMQERTRASPGITLARGASLQKAWQDPHGAPEFDLPNAPEPSPAGKQVRVPVELRALAPVGRVRGVKGIEGECGARAPPDKTTGQSDDEARAGLCPC